MSALRLDELAAQHCKPRSGAAQRLADERLDSALSILSGWQCVDDRQGIEKTFEFQDYYRTMAFVNALAYIAHREDHHPDLSVHYNRCVVRYSTHDVGGLSENDLICAAKVEQLVAQA